jgi:hypothetical protein
MAGVFQSRTAQKKPESNRLGADVGQNHFGHAARSEQSFVQQLLGGHHLVQQLLIFGQFSNEAEH